jgi:hypothetical protein
MRVTTYFRNNGNGGTLLVTYADDKVVFVMYANGSIKNSYYLNREYFERASHFTKIECDITEE